ETASATQGMDQAVQNGANPADALYQRGIVRSTLADNKGAVADFDAAIAAHPDFTAAYFKRSKLRTAMGDRDAAEADLQRVAELTAHLILPTKEVDR
ncbi:MAG: hypothetical protein H7Z11_11960, partial [Verrucomicrobia bacterium]|nr:hypothetical protein [Leptolyngbya sp. ES-bin-22]